MLNITFNENNIKNIFKNILINSSLFVKDNENNVPPKKVNWIVNKRTLTFNNEFNFKSIDWICVKSSSYRLIKKFNIIRSLIFFVYNLP